MYKAKRLMMITICDKLYQNPPMKDQDRARKHAVILLFAHQPLVVTFKVYTWAWRGNKHVEHVY